MRVAVVGAGVIGLSCAFALSEDGHDVVVLDRGELGDGVSAGNTGWVVPSLSTPLAAPGVLREGLRHGLDPRGALVIRPRLDPSWLLWLWRFARASRRSTFERGVEALLRLSRITLGELDRMADNGVRFEQHAAGLLAVARDPAALHWFDDVFRELGKLGFEGGHRRLGPAEARDLEPALSESVGAALHATIDRHVEPSTLTSGLAEYLAVHGVVIRTRVAVERVDREGHAWRVVLGGGSDERADAVVVAAAMGSVELLRPFMPLPLVAAKGYSVTLADVDRMPSLALYLCEPKLGLSPFESGLRIAGFFELGARDATPSADRCRQLVEEARPYLAGRVADPPAGERGWAGFRPATPDSLPLLGRVPGAPGLVLATGHGMLGVTLAPATGAAVAGLLRGEDDAWLAPFAPGRFG